MLCYIIPTNYGFSCMYNIYKRYMIVTSQSVISLEGKGDTKELERRKGRDAKEIKKEERRTKGRKDTRDSQPEQITLSDML